MTAADIVILSVTGLSVLFDLCVRRIPNWLILFGLGSGLILNLYRGLDQFAYSLLGFVVGIVIFVIPFSLGWIGAGDVKYFGVVGALLGVQWLPRVLFYSAIVAGVIAVGYVVTGRHKLRFFSGTWADLKIAILTFGRILPAPKNIEASNGSRSVPWGVAFGLGTIFAYYFDPSGSLAGF